MNKNNRNDTINDMFRYYRNHILDIIDKYKPDSVTVDISYSIVSLHTSLYKWFAISIESDRLRILGGLFDDIMIYHYSDPNLDIEHEIIELFDILSCD